MNFNMSTRSSTRITRLQNTLVGKPPLAMKHKENGINKASTLGQKPLKGKGVTKTIGIKRKVQNENDQAALKPAKKRSAFGDITNAIEKTFKDTKADFSKAKIASKTTKQAAVALKSLSEVNLNTALKVSAPLNKPLLDLDLPPLSLLSQSKTISQDVQKTVSPKKKQAGHSPKLKSEEAKADPVQEVSISDSITTCLQDTLVLEDSNNYVTASEGSPIKRAVKRPDGVCDFDEECAQDIFAVPTYAHNIFEYYKEREKLFPVEKYMTRQPDVSRTMRCILVDWMVEVQESFELNHETLYLAVKIVDLYLSKVIIKREKLQLVGSTAIFIACKFDERIPPFVDDFLYICDDAYKRKELLALEIEILKKLKFDLGIPLSYRFLRRYARCAKITMENLTFARYILELSLTDYELIDASDSIIAAAALCLALTIKGVSEWTPTLQFYSGYSQEDIYHYVHLLHNMLIQPQKEHLQTIKNKYSHAVFMEVAKIAIPESLDI